MPERNFDALDGDQRRQAVQYVPGYDWIPGKFGPPPGIPKDRKEQFDRMSDKEYLYAFLKLSQEEKESLMVSERERRRSFAAHWPIETIVKANDCAKEGFYYTGVADRVQCAFCGGIVRNWERGDVPKFQHRNFFNYCKMVQNKPCHNIPISDCGLPKDLMTSQLSSSLRKDCKPATLGDLNINTNKPKDPALSVFSKRMETYRRYPSSNPIAADKLCNAGFLYEGIGDKVKCFWCDGALEMWSRGDDPWSEHAKWYPGCTYVQETKGLDFIRTVRSQMSPENIATSETLLYNKGDVYFLEESMETSPEPVAIKDLGGYQYCDLLVYPEDMITRAYEANKNVEFEEPTKLVEIVQELCEGNSNPLEEYKKEVAEKIDEQSIIGGLSDSTTQPGRKVNVVELISNPGDLSEQDSKALVDALRCKKCKRNMAGAVVLPCGCYCLCQECSKGNLPLKCPTCSSVVKGACKIFLADPVKVQF